MKKLFFAFVMTSIAGLSVTTNPAFAQQASIGTLLEEGYEIKGVAAADLEPGEGAGADNVFVILQKDTQAFGCVLRSINSSFCQRMQ
ncbi:MAG: hypothetical protein WA921_12560 [Ahrensia sp.]